MSSAEYVSGVCTCPVATEGRWDEEHDPDCPARTTDHGTSVAVDPHDILKTLLFADTFTAWTSDTWAARSRLVHAALLATQSEESQP